MQEQPTDRQEDGRRVVTFLARCVAQHEGLVRVIVRDIIASVRCNDDLEDNDDGLCVRQ